jgi:glycosyltransferase involved in cell wall biosynthesis
VDAVLRVVGDGPDRRLLEKLVHNLDLDASVDLMGWLPDPIPLMSESHFLVHSALVDNAPYVILESLAVGLPVVARESGGVPELVSHGETGFLYSDTTIESVLPQQIAAVYRNEHLYRQLSTRARQRFAEAYTEDAQVSLWLSALGLE